MIKFKPYYEVDQKCGCSAKRSTRNFKV